jgi:DNA mismatch repair protein MutS
LIFLPYLGYFPVMSTPLMKQYAQVKARYPDTILLFRMGDFFETFEEDAITTSRVLGITLTRRGNGAAGEIPLAGFPHHALDAYLPKLLKAGHRVAVCEQLEDPRFAKGIVKRDVVEVVTPGVAFSDRILDQKQNNFLAAVVLPSAIAAPGDPVGFAYVDASTGEFKASQFPLRQLPEQVGALQPAELVLQRRDRDSIGDLLRSAFRGLASPLDDWVFSEDYGRDALLQHFKTQSLKGFGLEESPLAVRAAGAIMHYLKETQKGNLLQIRRLVPFDTGETMVLDPSTKRNLEISSSLAGSTDGTLIGVLDHTLTPMGSRMLKRWLHAPLRSVDQICRRLDAVDELVRSDVLRPGVRGILQRFGDLERLNARVCTGRATPREVVALRQMLVDLAALRDVAASPSAPALIDIRDRLQPIPEVVELIGTAIADDPPASLSDGGVIRPGFNADLDELRRIATGGKSWIADLQRTERERTGIASLKVGFNSVFGYYIEVTNTHREKIPADYVRKQTLTNAERYITPDLKVYEDRILHAEERMLALETELFTGLRLRIAVHAETIQDDPAALAALDCFASLAEAAVRHGYSRPDVNDSTALEIRQGRHPVIERLLPPGEQYIPNDLRLDTSDAQILIVTGPNMSGKSSYLRQAGLIVLLAQIGSFVPAAAASVGVVDRIFTRVGASDNIASGESTFLVEMHEAAHIVNAATNRSLILLDEVGRGTSTFDGISIAWALTEYLHERVGARTLFATHYHELNELADLFPRIRNVKVDVREYDDRVVFLHTVTPGSADHSYGIQVAQMAGLPEEVTARARTILRNLEGTELTPHAQSKGRAASGRVRLPEPQLTLFEMRDDPIRQAIQGLDLERMTPLEALHVLASLKKSATT